MLLHRELKKRCEQLQSEVSAQSESELKKRLDEAEKGAQEAIEKRYELQKELSKALEKCQKEQETNLSLLKQLTEDQNMILSLRKEIHSLQNKTADLERRLEASHPRPHVWKAFKDELENLIQKTSKSIRRAFNSLS